MASRQLIRIGVDTGGTFTDFVFERDGRLILFKLPSTPSDPSLAIRQGLDRICAETGAQLDRLEVVHGTTVGTNALLQRRGARIALVTTRGFEDVLVIGRQARPELYNLNAIKPPPLVEDELRLGVRERVVASGEVIEPLDERELDVLVKKLRRSEVEAVAISLLFSFLHPEHEERIAAALGSLGVPLSISSRILPEYREYERTSTVVSNAYLQPLMGRYLNRLSKTKLRVMQSSGGSISAEVAAIEPVRTNEEAVRGADLIVTATSSLEPVINKDWISPGAHVNAIGTHSPNSREIDSATMAAARIFTDRRESALNEAGDYLLAAKEGLVTPESILGEIGELLIRTKTGRTSSTEITLFKSLGLAIEDVVSADYLYHKAPSQNAGTWIDF